MERILERLDIYGIPESSEDAILACLLQGEPGLLVGPPGTAKTEILELIGASLRESDKRKNPNKKDDWFSCQIYDTSKLNPEDLLGFPNPKSIMEGKMDYVQLPSTVWGKQMVVFDEVNRCEKSRQSNLFEIIRSRRINGIPTGNKFIFSAMNPLGDTGTVEMSEALTDRHVFYIWFSQFDSLIEEDKHRIIGRVGSHESVGMRHWGNRHYDLDTEDGKINEKLADVGDIISQTMTEAASVYENLKTDIGNKISRMIVRIISAISEEKGKKDTKINLDISGRRASMMLRALLSLRAIQIAKAKVMNTPIPSLEATLCNGSTMAVPVGISQKATVDVMVRIKTLITETVKAQYALLFDNSPDADRIYAIFYDKNPLSKLNSILQCKDIPKMTEQRLWTELYTRCKDTELEAMLGILNNTYNIIPPHIEISKEVIQKEKARKDFSIDKPYAAHQKFIQNLTSKVQSEKVLDFCITRTLYYLSRIGKKHTQAEVINNLQIVDQLATTLLEKLTKLNANKNANTATVPNP